MKHYRIYDTEEQYQQAKPDLVNLQQFAALAKQEDKLFINKSPTAPPYILPNISIVFNDNTHTYTDKNNDVWLLNDSDKRPVFLKQIASQGSPSTTNGYIAQISSSDKSIQQITGNENYSVYVRGIVSRGASPSGNFEKNVMLFVFGSGEKLDVNSDLGQQSIDGMSSEELNDLASSFKSYKGYWGLYSSNMTKAFFFLFKDDKYVDNVGSYGVPLYEYASFKLIKDSIGYHIEIAIEGIGTTTVDNVEFEEDPCMYIQCYKNIGSTYMLEYLRLKEIKINQL